MPYNYLAIANGKRVSKDLVKSAEDILALAEGNLEGEILVTKDLNDLDKVIRQYKEEHKDERLDFAVIFSGDGGVMHTRTRMENILGYRPIYAAVPNGTKMNIQRAAGIKNPLPYLRYIAEKASLGELEQSTISFPSLDLDGYKGFNVGFGLIPKLLWMYYGKSAEQYVKLEEALQTAEPQRYLETYKKVMEQYPEEIVKENGLAGVCRAAWKSLNGLLKRKEHSFEGYLLSTSIKGDIIVDGEKKVFPRPPLGLYISCYEEVNLGWSLFNPVLSPEARTEPEKFQVIAPHGNPLRIALEFPKVIRRKHLSKAEYFFASALQIQTSIAEVDGEIILHDGFNVKYDGEVKIISPLANPLKNHYDPESKDNSWAISRS